MSISTKLLAFSLMLLYNSLCGNCKECGKIEKLKDKYDFIVVGAGSAGAVVAHRLSEIENAKVLLLEAGYDEDPILNQIPGEAPFLVSTDRDWHYKSTKQPRAPFGEGKSFNMPRGKGLGGTSAINYMLFVRGNKHDYESWNKQVGSGWSYKEVLPFFKKSEDFRITPRNEEYHSIGGLQTVSNGGVKNPFADLFLKAGNDMSLPTVDYNGASQFGVSNSQSSIRDGARCSTNKAFLKSAADRKNLDIVTGAFVTKILVKPDAKKKMEAYAVNFTRSGCYKVVTASKEIILSAGGLNSPQLLMLSGIGPKKHLEQFKIPVLVDLPGVGQNLQDHMATFATTYYVDTKANPNVCPSPDKLQAGLLEWIANGTGYLSAAPVFATGFVNTKYADASGEWPDIQLLATGLATGLTGKWFASVFSIEQEIFTSYYEPKVNENGFAIVPVVLRPKSRGSITLTSADPFTPPIIDPQFFGNKDDLKVLIEGAKIAHSFSETKTFKDNGIKLNNKPHPGCEKFQLFSDDYYECMVTLSLASTFHFAGTCKMSKSLATDPMGVVDPKLKVHGVEHLSVVDTSIMPTVPSGNTNSPAIMVGERGADFVKERWDLKRQ